MFVFLSFFLNSIMKPMRPESVTLFFIHSRCNFRSLCVSVTGTTNFWIITIDSSDVPFLPFAKKNQHWIWFLSTFELDFETARRGAWELNPFLNRSIREFFFRLLLFLFLPHVSSISSTLRERTLAFHSFDAKGINTPIGIRSWKRFVATENHLIFVCTCLTG